MKSISISLNVEQIIAVIKKNRPTNCFAIYLKLIKQFQSISVGGLNACDTEIKISY